MILAYTTIQPISDRSTRSVKADVSLYLSQGHHEGSRVQPHDAVSDEVNPYLSIRQYWKIGREARWTMYKEGTSGVSISSLRTLISPQDSNYFYLV